MSAEEMTEMDVKLCRQCKKIRKFPEEFDKDPSFQSGRHQSRCKHCRAVNQFKVRHKDIDITEDFDAMLAAVEAQVCMLCGTGKQRTSLVFDINKEHKRWRGLLCRLCYERVKDYDGLDERRLRSLAKDANPHLAKIPKYMLSR